MRRSLCDLPNYWADFDTGPKRHSVALYVNFPNIGWKFDLKVIDDVTGQVKVGMFEFSGLVISLSKITMVQTKPMNRHGCCI